MDVLTRFLSALDRLIQPEILEMGTKRSNPERSTTHQEWAPHAARWVRTDLEPGLDVDVVADAHRLSHVFGTCVFDAVVSCSVFEHLRFPWLVAQEIAHILKPGGFVFVQTHQTFPLRAYPYDYWRFSREALTALFEEVAGMEVLATDYEFPCRILSERDPSTADGEAYLNVRLLGRKQS